MFQPGLASYMPPEQAWPPAWAIGRAPAGHPSNACRWVGKEELVPELEAPSVEVALNLGAVGGCSCASNRALTSGIVFNFRRIKLSGLIIGWFDDKVRA